MHWEQSTHISPYILKSQRTYNLQASDLITLNKIILLDILEVFIGTDFQFIGSRFIAYDDAMLVHLQCADGPHVIDTTLNSGLQSTCLMVAVDQNHHLTSIHHGTYAHSECVFRHPMPPMKRSIPPASAIISS